MKTVASLLACVLVVLVLGLRLRAQNEPGPGMNEGDRLAPTMMMGGLPQPQTRLEALSLAKGSVLIRGYTDIGAIEGENDALLRVTAVEIADTTRGSHESGLAIQVGSRGNEGGPVSFVDAVDIKPLLDAIDAVVQTDHSATRLGDYETSYRTKGDLEISNIRTNAGRIVRVASTQVLRPSGQVVSSSAAFRLSRLAEIRQQIAAGQEALDRSSAENK